MPHLPNLEGLHLDEIWINNFSIWWRFRNSSEMRNMNFLWIVNLTIYDLDILFDCFDIAAFSFYFGATCPFLFFKSQRFSTGLRKVINYRICSYNSKQIKLSFLDSQAYNLSLRVRMWRKIKTKNNGKVQKTHMKKAAEP